jgi:hypothetical protein
MLVEFIRRRVISKAALKACVRTQRQEDNAGGDLDVSEQIFYQY